MSGGQDTLGVRSMSYRSDIHDLSLAKNVRTMDIPMIRHEGNGKVQTIASEGARQARKKELEARDRDIVTEAEQARLNKGFVQVYAKGFARLQDLIQKNPSAARLYVFLCQHVDGTCNGVTVSQEVLASNLGCSVKTIQRHTKALEEMGAFLRMQVGLGVYMYAMDPYEVSRTWADRKEDAAFLTKTLVRKTDRGNRTIDRKLKIMVKEQA